MNTNSALGRPAEILLVEDNESDVELTRLGFQAAKFWVNLHHVDDGEECMVFLRKEEKYAGVPTPDLILLDLNMPRMSGREVLAEIVRDDHLKHIPVVVLTTSDADADILNAYRLRCSSYIVKPIDFDNFARVIRGITDYWFTLVVLPPERGNRA